jgi:DNA-binding winged helix-turn-helix (wHTH) protein
MIQLQMDGSARYRFGAFELDVRNARLQRDGVPVKLAPQPFAALALLVQRAGVLVTREEMRLALWGDDHHVDVNAGVNFCMAQLRAALGEDAALLIETVPRRGYRFITPVSIPEAARPEPRSRAHYAWAGAAIVLAVLIAGMAATQKSRSTATPVGSSSLAAIAHREHAALGLADTSPGDLPARIAELHEAIAADPSFARAYADLAEAHLMQAQYRVDEPQVAYANAKAAAMRALELQPSLGEAHAAYAAAVLHLEWSWPAAREHFAEALRRSSDNPRVLYWYGRYLAADGRADEAIATAERAVRLDAAGVRTRTNLGFVSLFARRYDRALAACEQALDMMDTFTPARFCAQSARAGMNPGNVEYWRTEFREIEAAGCDRNAFPAAVALARLGEDDSSLRWLERAVELHADAAIYAGVHPAFDGLRGTPRFEQVLRRVGR